MLCVKCIFSSRFEPRFIAKSVPYWIAEMLCKDISGYVRIMNFLFDMPRLPVQRLKLNFWYIHLQYTVQYIVYMCKVFFQSYLFAFLMLETAI